MTPSNSDPRVARLDFTEYELRLLIAGVPETLLAHDCELAIRGVLPMTRMHLLQQAVEQIRR